MKHITYLCFGTNQNHPKMLQHHNPGPFLVNSPEWPLSITNISRAFNVSNYVMFTNQLFLTEKTTDKIKESRYNWMLYCFISKSKIYKYFHRRNILWFNKYTQAQISTCVYIFFIYGIINVAVYHDFIIYSTINAKDHIMLHVRAIFQIYILKLSTAFWHYEKLLITLEQGCALKTSLLPAPRW